MRNRLSVTVLALVAYGGALAQGIPGYGAIEDYDPREVALVPRYCIHTQLFRDRVPGGSDAGQIKRWYTIMGPAFDSMHHYCWGLMRTNRAILLARTNQAREFYLESSVQEFDYVLRNAPGDFVLRPEILTKKGENLLKLGKVAAGLASLQEAIEMKTDYWPPYVAISDHFKRTGDLTSARDWLMKGLAASPDAQPLTNRLRDWDKLNKSRSKK
jgi:hypothetical protein